jgi:phospholipid/cholesterol/gamma-HCH transport system permease protein
MASLQSIGSAVIRDRRKKVEEYGDQLLFYVKALSWTPRALRRYKREILSTLAEVAFGVSRHG